MIMKTTYKTSDFLTATVLLLRKHRLFSTDTSDARRVIFLFTNTSELQKDLLKLQHREIQVDPVDFWTAERRCKQLIHERTRL